MKVSHKIIIIMSETKINAKPDKPDTNKTDTNKTDTTNMFDLSSIIGIQNEQEIKQASTIVSADEQKQLLQNYEEIDVNKWSDIQPQAHIRYLRKDGAFRRGGFVKNVWVGINGNTKDKKCIQLSSSMYYTYKTTKWTVCFDDIDKIWRKKEVFSGVTDEKNIISPEVHNTIQSSKESIEYLTRTVDQLKIEIAKINNEQTRMVNLIKKLYNIKVSNRKQ